MRPQLSSSASAEEEADDAPNRNNSGPATSRVAVASNTRSGRSNNNASRSPNSNGFSNVANNNSDAADSLLSPITPTATDAKPAGNLYLKVKSFRETLQVTFGEHFLTFLFVVFAGLKGLGSTLLSTAMLPMLQTLGATGTQYQLASLISSVPWAMKGFVGVLSDCVPIMGFHKKGYLVGSSLFGCMGLIGLLSGSQLRPGVWLVAFFFFLVNVQYATFDLLCEGKYTELMKARGGSEAVTFAWLCVNGGSLLASILTLFIVDSRGSTPLLASALPFTLTAAFMAWKQYLPEEKLGGKGSDECCVVKWKKLMSQPWLFALSVSMAVGALIVAISAATLSSRLQLLILLVVSIALCVLGFCALPRALAKCNLYMFLVSLAYVDLSGALAYYYTGSPKCIADAPHFSYSYYLAVTNIVGGIGGVIGSLLFHEIRHWTFRKAFWLTTAIQVLASGFDLIIVYRLNIKVGISDEAMFLFGDAACQQIAQQLAFMPSALLNSLLCPRGAEATVYAILAGFQNFGLTGASILGVFLTSELGIRSSPHQPGGCDFSQLGNALWIAHVILPLLCLPLTNCLIPNKHMSTGVETQGGAAELGMDESPRSPAMSPAPSFTSPPQSSASRSLSSTPSASSENFSSPRFGIYQDSLEAHYTQLVDDGIPIVMRGFDPLG